jgi:L-Ala-D/L-Glu epimerase
MKITAVEVYRKDLPLTTALEHAASGLVPALEEVYVVLQTDQGVAGVGEARGNAAYVTGIRLRPSPPPSSLRVLGRDPCELNALLAELRGAAVGVHGALSVIDIALHDLVAKAYGVPVFDGWGVQCARKSNLRSSRSSAGSFPVLDRCLGSRCPGSRNASLSSWPR